MVTVLASGSGSWRGHCPEGPAGASGTVPPAGHSSPQEVAGWRRPLAWWASQVTLSLQFSRQRLGRGVE